LPCELVHRSIIVLKVKKDKIKKEKAKIYVDTVKIRAHTD